MISLTHGDRESIAAGFTRNNWIEPGDPYRGATMSTKLAAKLRTIAGKLQSDANAKRGPRQENTPKRLVEGMRARHEAGNYDRAAEAAIAMADALEAGTLPPKFCTIKSRKALEELTDRLSESLGYYHCATSSRHRIEDPFGCEFRAWVESQRSAESKAKLSSNANADRIRTLENSTKFANIPGFFPTPPAVIELMLEAAGDLDGKLVLDPSAGIGTLLDAAKAAGADARGIEICSDLVDVCMKKNHCVLQGDFPELDRNGTQYDVVLMNPPFERAQDAQHVMTAMEWLKNDGILVAVMSASAKHSQMYVGFRLWLLEKCGTMVDLPPGSFKSAHCPTGVSTVLVTIRAGMEQGCDHEDIADMHAVKERYAAAMEKKS